MLHLAKACGCTKDIGMSKCHQPHYCDHGNLLVYTKPLARSDKQNTPSPKRRTLKRGRGFAASKEQQAKVRDLPCIICGRDRHEGVEIQAAHVYPRRLQACECAEGVVPLCSEDHARYDDQDRPLDLLPSLVTRGYHAEIVHAVAAHGVPLRELIEQITGTKWVPLDSPRSGEEEA